MGLEANTFFSIWVSVEDPPTVAKYRIAYLADTVLPAPDSPLTIIDWFWLSLKKNKIKSHVVNMVSIIPTMDNYQSIQSPKLMLKEICL